MNCDMEEIIERLTKQKSELISKHRQQILIKDKFINQMNQNERTLNNENKMLKWKLNQCEDIITNSTQAIDGLLFMLKFDESFDDKEMSENFQKFFVTSNENDKNISSSSHSSKSKSDSKDFSINPLEAAISSLLQTWQNMAKKFKNLQDTEKMNFYLKDQIKQIQAQQRTLRNQKTVLERINQQSERSRNQIAQKIKRSIQSALTSNNMDLQVMSIHELKDKLGLFSSAIKELDTKIKRLEEELYTTKAQCSQKMEIVKHQSAKIKQKHEADVTKKNKQIHLLKTHS